MRIPVIITDIRIKKLDMENVYIYRVLKLNQSIDQIDDEVERRRIRHWMYGRLLRYL